MESISLAQPSKLDQPLTHKESGNSPTQYNKLRCWDREVKFQTKKICIHIHCVVWLNQSIKNHENNLTSTWSSKVYSFTRKLSFNLKDYFLLFLKFWALLMACATMCWHTSNTGLPGSSARKLFCFFLIWLFFFQVL